jgi:DNA-binding CsgD family transcriptional regulator
MLLRGLSSSRVRALSKLIDTLQQGIVSAGDFDEVLEGLSGFYESAAIAITQSRDFVGPGRQFRIPREWPEIHQRYLAQDPCLRILEKRGIGDGLVTQIYSPFSNDLHLVLYREAGRRRFSEEDHLLVRLLQPHLAGAFAATCALSHLGSLHGAPALPAAAPILAQLGVAFPGPRFDWTRAARELFDARLGPISSDGWNRIERLILNAANRFEQWQVGGRSQLLLAGLRVEFANLPPKQGEERRVSVLFLAGSAPAPPLLGEELLSARQREVAREAAQGRTTAQIARSLGIGAETVRFHLKEAFRRLGVRRRAELARLISPGVSGRPRS